MTTAPQLAVGQTSQNIDDASYSIFQLVNNPNAATVVAGNFFFGLQAAVALAVPMGELLGLQRGANIETGLTPAAVSFTAAGTWTAGGTIFCNVMLDNSPRFSSEDGLGEAGPYDSRYPQKSPNGFGPAWRQDRWGVFDLRLEDTGGSPFLDQLAGTGGTFGLRAVAGKRDEMSARFIVPAGPGWSVARALLKLRRVGNPIGSLEVAIQASQANPFGSVEPDGVDLGVSAAVLNSTIPASPGSGDITYAFSPDVVLPPGTYWLVLRSAVPYPVSLTDFVVWLQARVFLGVGGSHRTLSGVRFDLGNFPGHIDMATDLPTKQVGTDIVWNPIARVSGQSIATPDLSPLVEEVIRNSGHETTSALCFTFRTDGETRTYRFASHAHATLNPPGFACQFRPRLDRGEVF